MYFLEVKRKHRLGARRRGSGVKAAADQAQGLPPLVLRVYNVDTVAEHLGAFEQAVLLALVRPQTPLGREGYGRAILKEVQHRLERDVSAGAVYATLDRLSFLRRPLSGIPSGA